MLSSMEPITVPCPICPESHQGGELPDHLYTSYTGDSSISWTTRATISTPQLEGKTENKKKQIFS